MKEEILKKIENEELKKYVIYFSELTGLTIEFQRLTNRVRAEYSYTNNSNEFIIRLGSDWKEVDIAHELMHGNVMFLKGYGLILCNNDLCDLIRAYFEDIIVHEEILNKFRIIPYDNNYVTLIKDLTGNKIKDSYWDPKGSKCNHLHKAFLFVQVWHFNQLEYQDYFIGFLDGFRKVYGGQKEIELADELIRIIERNDYLNNKENYENALQEIIDIPYLSLPKSKLIHHYEKNVGYTLN